tara:strand:- start:579 stop:1718 length:1140 start_codon:yes stop_codon:yes gene_type:complete
MDKISKKLNPNIIKYVNNGVALFKLGKINDSIQSFKNAIKENPNSNLAHNNLGISYLELGIYSKALKHFLIAIKINENDLGTIMNLINVLTLYKSSKKDEHPLIYIDHVIGQTLMNYKDENLYFEENLTNLLIKSNDHIKKYNKNLYSNETQLFRKNSKNLNCNRHFKVFNEYNIIPKYCFSCYKVQINLSNVVDLIKLFLVFNNLYLKNNNIRKCIVEMRQNIKGNYKGYIYCESISEAQDIIRKLDQKIKEANINNFNLNIKHGCSEYYKSYPAFEEISNDEDKEFKYFSNWAEKEKLIDLREPGRLKKDQKILGETLKGIHLSDILIINNWISYADATGDYSYKKIYNSFVNSGSMKKYLENQINFRKENLSNKFN